MITPAISVLSAIGGVKVAAPSLSDLVIPITAATWVPQLQSAIAGEFAV